MRKVYVNLQVRLIIEMEEGLAVADVIDEMDYKFTSTTDGAIIADTEIQESEVTDSK
jgi:hypothetical protein